MEQRYITIQLVCDLESDDDEQYLRPTRIRQIGSNASADQRRALGESLAQSDFGQIDVAQGLLACLSTDEVNLR